MSTTRAGAALESAEFIPVRDDSLFGVLTRPATRPVGTAVVFLPGGGFTPWMHRGFPVTLSRRVAEMGYHGLRFDWRGVGESTGQPYGYMMGRPAVEDLEGVVDWLRGQGLERFVMVGVCFGAVTSLAAADGIEGLAGVVVVSTPLHEQNTTRTAVEWSAWSYLRRGLRPTVWRRLLTGHHRRAYLRLLGAKVRTLTGGGRSTRWVKDAVFGPLRGLAARGIPTLIAYGDEDGDFEHFKRGEPELAASAPSSIDVRVLPGRIHAFDTLDGQDMLLEAVIDWLVSRRVGRPGG